MPDLFANFWFLLFGTITVIVVVVTLAITWSAVHQSAAELAFKEKLVERGMSVEEIERLMSASPSAQPYQQLGDGTSLDEDALNEVVTVLGEVGISAAVLEEVLRAFRAVDPSTQAVISSAIQHLVGAADDVNGEQILAVVRSLSRTKVDPPRPAAAARDERVIEA